MGALYSLKKPVSDSKFLILDSIFEKFRKNYTKAIFIIFKLALSVLNEIYTPVFFLGPKKTTSEELFELAL